MSILGTNNKQLIFVYSEDSYLGRKALKDLNKVKESVRIINLNTSNLADMVWIELLSILQKKFTDVIDKKHFVLNKYSNVDEFLTADWLRVIKRHPYLLKKPIAIKSNQAIIINKRQDVVLFFNSEKGNDNICITPEYKSINPLSPAV